jgi:hypothetical protein
VTPRPLPRHPPPAPPPAASDTLTGGGGRAHEVLSLHERSGLQATRADLATLAPGEWLNDEVMNLYTALLQVRRMAACPWGRRCVHAREAGRPQAAPGVCVCVCVHVCVCR